MNFLILGAGGIGCYYGAKLLKAGHKVTFVARGDHLNVLQNKGLMLTHPSFTFQGGIDAIDQDTLLNLRQSSDYDMVILAFKSMSTEVTLKQLEKWLNQSKVPVLSLQNGVDNESHIARIVGDERTIGGLAVRIGGHIIQPGVVEAKGVAQVVFGQWPNSQLVKKHEVIDALDKAFSEANIDAFQSDDIQRELWRKLMINNGVNPISVLTEWDSQKITSHPIYGKTVYKMMQETACAAKADNVLMTANDVNEMFELISNFDAIKTSMLVDYEKGRPLELEDISGSVIKRCQAQGLDCSTTELISALVATKIQ